MFAAPNIWRTSRSLFAFPVTKAVEECLSVSLACLTWHRDSLIFIVRVWSVLNGGRTRAESSCTVVDDAALY